MKRIIYTLVILFWVINCYAQDDSTSVGRFLLLGGGARPGALGGAYSAVAEDGSTIAWNPAGLGAVKSFELSFMHMLYGYERDISFDYIASTIPLDFGTFGLSFIYLGMTPLAEIDTEGDQIHIITGDSIDFSDLAVSLSFGTEFYNAYSIGLNAKYIRNSIGIPDTTDYGKPQGFAIDFGLLARFKMLKYYQSAEKNLRFGAAIQNITITKLKYDEGEFTFPMVIKPGIFYRPIEYASLMFDYNLINDSPNTINAGLEILPDWVLTPRVGITIKDQLKSYTFGGGLKYNIGSFLIQFDYAYNLGHYFQPHMFSLALRKFSASLAEFGIGNVTINDVFPAMYKYYTKNTVTKVEIKNNTNIPIEKIKVSMFVNKNMDFPSERKVISSLRPGREATIELHA